MLTASEGSDTLQIIPQLEQQGWQVVWAKTGAEAFALIDQHRPLAAIVDVDLPDVTEWDIVTRLRQAPVLRSSHMGHRWPSIAPSDFPLSRKSMAPARSIHSHSSGEWSALLNQGKNEEYAQEMRRLITRTGDLVRALEQGM